MEGGEIVPGPTDRGRPHVLERPDSHPPLIDRKTFNKVQRLLEERKTLGARNRQGRDIYPLSGLLRCAHCGARMVGVKSGAHHVYRCARYHLSGKSVCNRNPLREDLLLACIIHKLQEFWTMPSNLARLKTELRRECNAEPEADENDRQRLGQRIAELDACILRGVGRLLAAPDTIYADLVTSLDEAKGKRAQLQTQIDAMGARSVVSDVDVERMVGEAVAVLHHLTAAVSEAKPGLIREALVGMVSHVDLHFRQELRLKMTKSIFERGTIHVRPGLESVNTVTPVTPEDSPRAAF
jgi:hypothetical protein